MNLVKIVDLIKDEWPLQEIPVLLSQGKHFFHDPGRDPQQVRVLII